MHKNVSAILETADFQLAQFISTQGVKEKCGKNSTIAFSFEGVGGGSLKKNSGTGFAEMRSGAHICSFTWSLQARDRIEENSICLAKIIKQGRKG